MNLQADGTIVIDTKIKTDGAKVGTEDIKRALSSTMDYIKLLPQAFKDIPSIAKYAFSSVAKSVKQSSPKLRSLQDEIDRYTDALYYAQQAGYGLGDAPYDKAYKGLHKAKQAAEAYKKQLLGVDKTQKKASNTGNKFNKETVSSFV